MKEILMPKMAEDMEEGILVEWLKREGDTVEKDESLFVIETYKSTMEIESRFSGTLLKIVRQAGETVAVAEIIGYMGQKGEKLPGQEPQPEKKAEAKPEKPEPPAAQPALAADGSVVLATPYAKKLARDNAVVLEEAFPGRTAPVYGRDVVKKLEEAPAVGGLAALAAPAPAPAAASETSTIPAAEESASVFPFKGIQKVVAQRLTGSSRDIPHISICAKADVTELSEVRDGVNEHASLRLSVNDFILKAVCMALGEFPYMNASLQGDELVYWKRINLGIAVALDGGLIVPNVKDAGRLTLAQLAAQGHGLIEKARAGSLRPDEYGKGTFTVSNLGMYGVNSFTSILNPPEAAILGVCAIENTLCLRADGLKMRKMLNLCLNIDHRIINGADGARFLQRVCALLEAPQKLLA